MNNRLNIILILITTALSIWYLSLQSSNSNASDQLIKKEGEAEYVGYDIKASTFDSSGMLQYQAEAKEIKYFQSISKTEFIFPVIKLFLNSSGDIIPQWKMVAKHAELDSEGLLKLSGGVNVENLVPNARLQRVDTDSLLVNLNTYDIFTDDEVLSQGMGLNSVGKGLVGNLKQQVATLKSNVKTTLMPVK